jgi:hypothetical protein
VAARTGLIIVVTSDLEASGWTCSVERDSATMPEPVSPPAMKTTAALRTMAATPCTSLDVDSSTPNAITASAISQQHCSFVLQINTAVD